VIVFGDSFRNSGWHENITTAKNENLICVKDGVAVLVTNFSFCEKNLEKLSN
jgi:hypothetical protein